VASVFGVPSAVANQAPLGVVFPFGASDIGIPKLLWSQRAGRYLTFAEILDGPLGIARFQRNYDEVGIVAVENMPEDIRDLALEMLERVEGRLTYSADDERLQTRFKSLFHDGHYSFGASSRAGRDFLRKYEGLFSAVPQTKAS
jgi:putative glycosyltransferase (TIGR04372 family)